MIGSAIAEAIAQIRATEGADAEVVVLAPSTANAALARQSLLRAGPFIRVDADTAEGRVAQLARPGLRARGLAPEPAGWVRAVLPSLLLDLPGTGEVERAALARPAWHPAVVTALAALEHAGVLSDELPALGAGAWLGPLLERLQGARRAAGLAGPMDVHLAALQGISAGSRIPAARARGVVILGDRDLTPDVEGVIRTFCAQRTTRIVLPPPLDRLEPAVGGLRAAAGAAPSVAVPSGDDGGPAHVRRHWRSRPAGPAPDGVRLLRCPDTDQEALEAVREAQAAARAGVPLDRIAIAPAAAAGSEALLEGLDAAGLPFVALHGPPLARRPAGRVARLLLDVAAGDESATTLHLLLQAPGVVWRRVVGRPAPRGRWRTWLVRGGKASGIATIVAAVLALPIPDDADPAAGEARATLVAALREIGSVVADLRAATSPGDLAETLVTRAGRWLAFGPDRAAYLAHLEPLARCRVPTTWAHARSIVEEALEQAVPHGALSDPAIRVLDPMNLLGAEYDLVIGLGLAAGALPARPQEDPLLTDDLTAALAERGRRLPRSSEVVGREDRRFAAMMCASAHQLVLSAPGWEVLEARPLLPSPYLLEVQAALRGEPGGYVDLERAFERRGTRGRTLPPDPDRATGPEERRAAAAWAGAEVRRVAAFPGARALLQAAWQGDPTRYTLDGAFNAWHGRVEADPLPLPGWTTGGTAWQFATLSQDPQRYYIQSVLGARTPADLPQVLDPRDLYATAGVLARVARLGFMDAATLATGLDQELAEMVLDPHDRARVAARLRRALRELAALAPASPAAATIGSPIPESPGWTLVGALGLVGPDGGLWAAGRAKVDRLAVLAEKSPALVFQAAATLPTLGAVAYAQVGGSVFRTTNADAWGTLRDRWSRRRALAEVGVFPSRALLEEVP